MEKWWQKRGWRMIQTNLREIDMSDIDAEVYVQQMIDFNANVALINAAGIIASYPTELPCHFQSEFLSGDSLKQIIDACHARDVRVFARTDFSKIRRPIYEMHPEWAYISPEGGIVDYNGDVHACINGGYQQEYVLVILRELLATLDFDGIFFNMGGYQVRDYSGNYHGICQCQSCQKKFSERFGHHVPVVEDMANPVFRRYQVFKRETSAETKQKVDAFIHQLRPDMMIDRAYELGFGFIRQESNTAVDRALPHWQYSATDNTKWAVSSYPFMKSSNTSVDFIDFPYRHVAVSPHQQKIRLAENLANGGDLDYYLIGRLDNHRDRSGYDGIQEMFAFHAENEQYFQNTTSLAKIALVNGQQDANIAEYRGWFRFLLENHFLFDTPVLAVMDSYDLSPYEAIILPDCRNLSDGLAQKLDAYVAEGGTLIASGQTGFFDTEYETRENPSLTSLGITKVEQIRDDMRSSYFEVQAKEKTVFTRFDSMDLIYVEPQYVYCEYEKDVTTYFRLIPPHNYGPPERCYWDTVVDRPGAVVTKTGGGKGIYIPWLPGALFHRQGHTNTFAFATDVLESVAGCRPVGGNLSPQVQVTHRQLEGGKGSLVHLVNHTGHFGNTWHEPVLIKEVEFTLETGDAPTTARSLVTGSEISVTKTGDSFTIHLSELDLFESILLT